MYHNPQNYHIGNIAMVLVFCLHQDDITPLR
jgi:hypothetical protein